MIIIKLTSKQKDFVRYFFENKGDAYAAAVRAGYFEDYAKKHSWKILQNENVKEYAAEFNANMDMRKGQTALAEKKPDCSAHGKKAKTHDKSVASADEIMRFLTDVMRGDENKKNNEKERLRAAELLGKKYSLFTDKTAFEKFDGQIVICGEDKLE